MTALVTLSCNVPVTPLSVAAALKAPVVTPVASPLGFTTPMLGVCDDQVTLEVRFCVELSE